MTPVDESAARARIRGLVRELAASPAGQALRSPAGRRERVAAALLHSSDPVLREIGAQVRDRQITPAEAIREPAYAEALRTALRQAAERLDAHRLAEDLAEFVNRQRALSA
jgi:hypothetical protein